MGRRGRGPVHLVEVGVHWPPETFLCRKLEGLAAKGMRVTVAANSLREKDATLRGVELLPPLGGGSAWGHALVVLFRSPRRFLRLVRNIWRVPRQLALRHGGRKGLLAMCLPLARLRPDVVQFEWNIAAVDHLPLFDVWGCPVVTSCRGSDLTAYPHSPRLEPYAASLPEVMRRAAAVHCVSESLRREAVEFGLEPAKARVIRPAINPELFRPGAENGNRGRDALRVIMISELRWEKGYEYALQAIRDLLDRDVPVQLELVGDGPPGSSSERTRILHTVSDLGLEGHVSLQGAATPAEVGRRLSEGDVLLQSSLVEGIPNVVLEAMACGVPVVTTNAGGVAEAVTDGVEGYVVGPRDAAGLSDALLRLWRDPELRGRMGAAGRSRIRSGFTLERQLQDFLALYDEVAGRR